MVNKKYKPKTLQELHGCISDEIERQGYKANLNCIDTVNITNMNGLFFFHNDFDGDISEWDVSNVTDMCGMFSCSKFNGDISKWDVSGVEDMRDMFSYSKFNGDLSEWLVSPKCDTTGMYEGCGVGENRKHGVYDNTDDYLNNINIDDLY